MKVSAMASKMLAIVAGVIAVAGIFAAYAIIGVGKDITNGNGITVNEQKRGKGTVDTLSFKNPVTIRLIDKDGNVASETVVYNDITAQGKTYIVNVLSDSTTTVAAIEKMRFADTSAAGGGAATSSNVLTDGLGNTLSVSGSGEQTCTITTGDDSVTCKAKFDFTDNYTPESDTTLNLASNRELRIGNGSGVSFTPYFALSTISPAINVPEGPTYTSIELTWTVTISSP
jgi:hypothetical protein